MATADTMTMTDIMSPHVTPYSYDIFEAVDNIIPQRRAFDAKDGNAFVKNVLAPIVTKHGLGDHFGIVLLHRHFDMAPDRLLVERNGTSTAWANVHVGVNIFNEDEPHLIYPNSFMLDPTTQKWMGYEHGFSALNGADKYVVDINDPKYEAFIVEFANALQSHGWDKLLGLSAWPGDGFGGFLEFTCAEANHCLSLHEFKGDLKDCNRSSETTWYYEPGFTTIPGCKTNCTCYCALNRIGGHVGHGHR